MSPSQREVDLVTDRKEVVAVVRFQHGDEVMRQKYQRCVVFMCPLCNKHGEFSTLLWPFFENENVHNRHGEFSTLLWPFLRVKVCTIGMGNSVLCCDLFKSESVHNRHGEFSTSLWPFFERVKVCIIGMGNCCDILFLRVKVCKIVLLKMHCAPQRGGGEGIPTISHFYLHAGAFWGEW